MPPEEDPEFQIAPMIDILLVLLVFFMSISSTQILKVNDKVRLPVAKDAKEVKPKEPGTGELLVNVLWTAFGNSGSLDVDGKTFKAAEDLAPMLVAKLAKTPNFRLLIRADKDVRYEYLRTVLQAAGKSGVNNVTFSVVDKEGATHPGEGATPTPK